MCEASYVVIGKRLTAHLAPRRITALVNLWGLGLVTPFGLWQLAGFDLRSVSAPTWALLLFYALAASIFTVWLWMRGLREVPAPQAGVFTVWLPIASAVVGVAVLGERPGWAQWGALGMALVGLAVVTWPARARG